METAVSAGRIDRNASDSDSAAPLEVGSVKDKIGRFTDNPHAVRPINYSGKDWKNGTHPPTTHDPLEHSSQKPTVPRKPVMLASTKPPEPIEIPTKPSTGQAESQKRPPFINELMGNHPGVRPAAPDHNSDRQSPSPHPSTSSNKPSPPSIQPRPKLPPRTGTSSSEQSSTSASSKRSLPLHIDRKPRLPPRRDTPPISRTNTDQGIIMQDNESPRNPLRSDMGTPSTRSLNENTSSLLDEPNIMVEPGPPKSTGTWPLASDREPPARKVPPPPPRQRRAGPQGEQMVSPPRNTTPNHLETKHKITAPEQTRYETVWAANKGLYIPSPTDPFYDRYPPGASEMVINLVVRDIWSRSCLPSDVLQQIWDLVDRQNVRLLTREEFVVGMWLIDRVLEGGRLPREVSGSVWGSLRSSSKVELL